MRITLKKLKKRKRLKEQPTMHAVPYVCREEKDLIELTRSVGYEVPPVFMAWTDHYDTRKEFLAEFRNWLNAKIRMKGCGISIRTKDYAAVHEKYLPPKSIPRAGTMGPVTAGASKPRVTLTPPVATPTYTPRRHWWQDDDGEDYRGYMGGDYEGHFYGRQAVNREVQHPTIPAPSGVSTEVAHAIF